MLQVWTFTRRLSVNPQAAQTDGIRTSPSLLGTLFRVRLAHPRAPTESSSLRAKQG